MRSPAACRGAWRSARRSAASRSWTGSRARCCGARTRSSWRPRAVPERPGRGAEAAIALAADGAVVAAAGRDFGVAAWRVDGGGELLRDEQARGAEHVAVAADATAAFDGVERWTVARAGAAPA